MNNAIRFVTLALVLTVFLLPGQAAAQTADLQFVATINAGAGTGGLDQLQVDVQMNTDISFELGNSTVQYTYNDGALAVPSGAVGNDPLVEGTDFDWVPPFQTGFVDGHWYTSTATLFGAADRPSLNITVIATDLGSQIAASVWTTIATLYYDITDGLQTAELVWIPGTDPNPIVINTDDDPVVAVTNGTFTNNDADLDAGLPVELVDFTALVDDSDAVLAWTTASENGNAGFAVEYAQADTDSWTELSFIESAGNTKSETGYTYR
ncbi:MAG: hypothetical protein HKN43_06695, partial [Rhodothermales bacterium]|nr:hypothetical protein [Rhodothermales bacterium]